MKFRAFVNRITGKPVDAADLYEGVKKSSPEEYAAGLAAELADVPDLVEGSDPPSRSRKKRVAVGRRGLGPIIMGGRLARRGLRLVRLFRKSKLATWRDSGTALRRYHKERYARLKREKTARRRNAA